MIFRAADTARRLAIVAVGGLLAACGGGGFGGGSSISDVDPVFLSAAGSWDTNRDGIVTCDEWKAYASDLFNSADKNRDGFLDTAEFAVMSRTDRMFDTVGFTYFDANKDGKIARTEMTERPNPAFVYLDKKQDCQLTTTELTGARALLSDSSPALSKSSAPATSTSPAADPARMPRR